ncbi:molecular chaperone GrpE [Halarchaeum rubridurum]|uniref:Protein GrpE n=1 Tax=Halarchaeum rubridurum TaxID=489911 RepID=A0A830G207_9EURY|nr:nucleotide exchange factor GrpE [Halarchaeum rubridurum]MBP1955354.1 molecular chaperone GrpE [Halarchaeum rubridurum]GGM71738.1 nucleotide exchange factor GrpE [Halarchaeum rubridurum]
MTDDADGVEVDAEDPEVGDAEADADEGADPETLDDPLAERVAEYDADLAEEVADVVGDRNRLAEDVEDLEAEVEDLEERLQRVQADFQNYKKRAKRKQAETEERATEDLVTRLLDVRDNLTRALSEESGDADSLREGVEMTKRELDRVFEDEGVAEIAPEPGTETDPHRHEVMLQVSSDEPEGTVAEVYRPGYEMGEKVLRAAQVTVSDGSGAGDAGDDE